MIFSVENTGTNCIAINQEHLQKIHFVFASRQLVCWSLPLMFECKPQHIEALEMPTLLPWHVCHQFVGIFRGDIHENWNSIIVIICVQNKKQYSLTSSDNGWIIVEILLFIFFAEGHSFKKVLEVNSCELEERRRGKDKSLFLWRNHGLWWCCKSWLKALVAMPKRLWTEDKRATNLKTSSSSRF